MAFEADFADPPNCGFSNRIGAAAENAPYWTQEETTGPNGEPAIKFTEIGGGDAAPFQHYIFAEHANSGTLEIPGYGESVFLRFYFKLHTPFFGSAQPDPPSGGDGSRWGNKFVIYGQGGPPSHRVIINFAALGDPSEAWFYVERGIEGAPSRIVIADPITLNTWMKLQFRFTASSVQDALDAEFAVWVDDDNADENNPTFTSTGFSWNAPLIGDQVNLGGFADTGDNITSGLESEIAFSVARFEISPTFDNQFAEALHSPPLNPFVKAALVE
jgi:hypothetical protein